MSDTHPTLTSTLSRRRVAQGAASAVPIVAAVAAAPATAASSCGSDPCLDTFDTDFGTSVVATNGWSLLADGPFYTGGGDQVIGWSNGVVYDAPLGANVRDSNPTVTCNSPQFYTSTRRSLSGPTVVAQGDPKASGSTITWFKTFCLAAPRTYTFQYNWISYGANDLGAYQRTYMAPGSAPLGAAATQLGSLIAAPPQSDNGAGTASVSFTPTTTGLHTFYFFWTFDTASSYPNTPQSDCDQYANDFAVNAPTVSCTG